MATLLLLSQDLESTMDMNNKLKEDALKQLKKLQQAMKEIQRQDYWNWSEVVFKVIYDQNTKNSRSRGELL